MSSATNTQLKDSPPKPAASQLETPPAFTVEDWKPFESKVPSQIDKPLTPEQQRTQKAGELTAIGSAKDPWCAGSGIYSQLMGGPQSTQEVPATTKEWFDDKPAGPVLSPSDDSSSPQNQKAYPSSPKAGEIKEKDVLRNPTSHYPNELKVPEGSGIPNFGGTFSQYAKSSDGNTRWIVKWKRPGTTEGVEVFQSLKRIVGDGELAYPADLRLKENEKYGGGKHPQKILNEDGLIDKKWKEMSVENRKKYRFKNGQPLFDNNGNPTFTTVRQLFFENGQAGHGTKALKNLEEAAGLKTENLENNKKELVKIDNKYSIYLAKSKHSGFWYAFTPDGKEGHQQYFLGEKRPTEDELSQKISAKQFTKVWNAARTTVIPMKVLGPNGREGGTISLVDLPSEAKLGFHKENGREQWIVNLYLEGERPRLVGKFTHEPTATDFAANTTAFRELQKALDPKKAQPTGPKEKIGIFRLEDGSGEITWEQMSGGPKGATWKMLFFPTGNKRQVDLGSSSVKPDKEDFKKGGRFFDELIKAQGKKITPAVLENLEGIGVEHEGKTLKVTVGRLGNTWYVLTPSKDGGWSVYPLERPETQGNQGKVLAEKAKNRVRNAIKSGSYSRLELEDGEPSLTGVPNPFLREAPQQSTPQRGGGAEESEVIPIA